MRVKVDSAGAVTAAGDGLSAPYINFPVFFTLSEMLAMKVITGMSGTRLLVQNGQVIARETGPEPTMVTITDLATGGTGTYSSDAISGLVMAPRLFTDAATTNATGQVTFTLPPNYFTTVTMAYPAVVRDTTAPASATFAMLRSISPTAVVAQCFESKTTGVLIGGTIEGLEASGAGIQVLLTVTGW